AVELALALLRRGFEHRLRNEIMLEAEERLAQAPDDAVIIGLSRGDDFGVDLAVARRHAVVGGALEHGESLGRLRNFRNRLPRRRAGADDGDAVVAEVDAGIREAAGLEPHAG